VVVNVVDVVEPVYVIVFEVVLVVELLVVKLVVVEVPFQVVVVDNVVRVTVLVSVEDVMVKVLVVVVPRHSMQPEHKAQVQVASQPRACDAQLAMQLCGGKVGPPVVVVTVLRSSGFNVKVSPSVVVPLLVVVVVGSGGT